MIALLANWRWFAAAGVVAVFLGSYHYGKIVSRQEVAVENAQAVSKAIQKRSNIDEDVSKRDSADWCIELGGLRSDCEQLRRVD